MYTLGEMCRFVTLVRVIAESEAVREFLGTDLRDTSEEEPHDEDGNVKVEMQIALPGRDPITMKTLKGSTTDDVYKGHYTLPLHKEMFAIQAGLKEWYCFKKHA
ncbi:putative sorting nexin-27 [Apostichopus japonicus]|uniref:Putative sorting nexin-27 n=1 Tax=Stichopus japonicus TaxID=307972 RepID=A0A2G8L5F5_STIJA|nr:putative sorting nexin-27 [Apostichopus japonicus]